MADSVSVGTPKTFTILGAAELPYFFKPIESAFLQAGFVTSEVGKYIMFF